MPLTNFANLTSRQADVWARDVWKTARNTSFFLNAATNGPMGAIHRVTELTKNNKGTRAHLTLIVDLANDGITGDEQLWDNEEEARAVATFIDIDQLRNATRSRGRFVEQKSVVQFRETSRDLLGYWMANTIDRCAAHILTGWPVFLNLNGTIKPGWTVANDNTVTRDTSGSAQISFGRTIADLDFFRVAHGSGDIGVANLLPIAPTANRHYRWDADDGLIKIGATGGAITNLTAMDTPSYEMFVQLKAIAKERRIRPVKIENGAEVYHVFLHPLAMARLKLDASFLANLRNAGIRGDTNPLFNGSTMTLDGLVFHELNNMPTTIDALTITGSGNRVAGNFGVRWGAAGTSGIPGARITLAGAQALALADIGPASYEEDTWDFNNQNAISVGKMFGLRRPRYFSPIDNTLPATQSEDFGTIQVDVAL